MFSLIVRLLSVVVIVAKLSGIVAQNVTLVVELDAMPVIGEMHTYRMYALMPIENQVTQRVVLKVSPVTRLVQRQLRNPYVTAAVNPGTGRIHVRSHVIDTDHPSAEEMIIND